MKRTRAFLTRLDRRLEGAVCAQRGLPIDHVHQIVELDRVDAVDPEAIERSADLLPRGAVGPLARLRGHEERCGIAPQPGRDSQFSVAVARGDVDVIDAVFEQHLKRTVRVALGHLAKRRGAKDCPT
jgi:hypothetical protein